MSSTTASSPAATPFPLSAAGPRMTGAGIGTVACVALAASGLAIFAVTLPSPRHAAQTEAQTAAFADSAVAASTTGVPQAADSTSRPAFGAEQFQSVALNALFVPLLGDDMPARWEEPASALNCADASVSVGLRRLIAGRPVPSEPFRIHWRLHRCTPLGDGVLISGTVDAVVTPEAGGYRATLRPNGLALDGPTRVVLWDAFDAWLPAPR